MDNRNDAHYTPETFHVAARYPIDDCPLCSEEQGNTAEECHAVHVADHVGWYWQACFPGCLPDGEPNGPFETEAEALADAQEGNERHGHAVRLR